MVAPKKMRRRTLSDSEGSPNPVKKPFNPPSSRKGSMLVKFGWLNTFSMVVRNSNDARSVILMFLITLNVPILVIASCTGFRGVLPKGVPKKDWAFPALMMKRTSLLVTLAMLHGVVEVAFSARQLWPRAVMLMS